MFLFLLSRLCSCLTCMFQMLDELTEMMIERLLLYEKKNKALPRRIFVFRDGVSEVKPSFVQK
jgi:hypothetical protein